MDNKFQLVDGMFVAQLSISVGGIHRTGYNVSDEDVGPGKEVVNQNKTTIANREQLKLANELKNRATGIFTKYRATACNWYILTRDDTLPKCQADLAELQLEIDLHNVTYPAHRVTVTFDVVEITMGITAAMMTRFYAEIESTLIGIEKAIRVGDFDEAAALQVKSKNFSKLLPILVGTMVDDALDQARLAVNDCRTEMRHAEKRATRLKQAYVAAPEALGRAADLSKLEAAIGWVTTHEVLPESQPNDGTTQPQANA